MVPCRYHDATINASYSPDLAQVRRRNSVVRPMRPSLARHALIASSRLVATLGSKSSLKKVTRKAIFDVDVGKTCDTIITPEAPMALRLQSNLL